MADGVVPNALVTTCEGYVREMVGIEPPLGRFVHVAGIDLVRDDDGTWRVLEDNLRCPSGLSYVVQNRAFMRRAFPEAFADHHVEPVGHAPFLLLSALMAAAPEGRDSPRVVVLTPGPANPAYYEHAFLAQQMGVPLVEGRDLTVSDRRVYLRTTTGRERGGRHLPAHRRRLPRPGQPAGRLPAGRRGPDAVVPRGPGGGLQRGRDRAWPTTRRSTPTCPT